MINGSEKKWWDQVEREYQNHSLCPQSTQNSSTNNSIFGHFTCKRNLFGSKDQTDSMLECFVMSPQEGTLSYQLIDCFSIEYSRIVTDNRWWSILPPVTFLHLDYIVCDNTGLIPLANVSGPVAWWWIVFTLITHFLIEFI